jgi:hypothetical protein
MVGGVTVKLVALKQEAGHLDPHFLGVTLRSYPLYWYMLSGTCTCIRPGTHCDPLHSFTPLQPSPKFEQHPPAHLYHHFYFKHPHAQTTAL